MRAFYLIMMLLGLTLVLVASIMVPSYFSRARPETPRPDLGQTVAFNNHGKVSYISGRDDLAYHLCFIGGAFFGLLGGTLHLRHAYLGRARSNP